MGFHNRIVGGECFKFVWRGYKRQASEFGNVFGHFHVIPLGRVQPCADCRAAECQSCQMRQSVFQSADAVVQLGGVGGKFLSQGERGGIHQVCPSNFHHIGKGLGFFRQSLLQAFDGGQGVPHNFLIGGNVHGGGIGVVGRLGFVHVVVGMDGAFLTQLAAAQHVGAVGNDFVQIHVGLRAATRLPDDERKLSVQLVRQNLIAGGGNQVALFGGQHTQIGIGKSGGFFQIGKGFNDFVRHGSGRTDFKIIARTLGLRPPVTLGGNVHFAHCVFFNAVFHLQLLYRLGCRIGWVVGIAPPRGAAGGKNIAQGRDAFCDVGQAWAHRIRPRRQPEKLIF